MDNDNGDDWLTPIQVVNLFGGAMYCDNIYPQIRLRMYRGLIACTAETVIDSRKLDGEYANNQPIPENWWGTDIEHNYHSFWRVGDIELNLIHGVHRLPIKIELFGVRLRASDVMALPQLNESRNQEEIPSPAPKESLKSISEAMLLDVTKRLATGFETSITEDQALSAARAIFPENHIAKNRFLEKFRSFRGPKKRGKSTLNR